MTVHIVRTLKTIRKESVTNQTCYFAPCNKTQRILMALPNLSATPKQLMHITVGQNGSVDPFLQSYTCYGTSVQGGFETLSTN